MHRVDYSNLRTQTEMERTKGRLVQKLQLGVAERENKIRIIYIANKCTVKLIATTAVPVEGISLPTARAGVTPNYKQSHLQTVQINLL